MLSWRWRRGWLVCAYAVLICCWPKPGAGAEGSDEGFIRGYVAAILQREFKMTTPAVTVEGRLISVAGDMSDDDRQKLQAILDENGHGDYRVVVETVPWVEPFPGPSVFRPLLADPRWPHFSAAYHYYIGDSTLKHAATVSFGESFSLVRFHVNSHAAVDIGIHAGVFAIFDLASDSFDLLNADYLVGLPIAYRNGKFTALLRGFHQSSHLGDEFVLRHSVPKRVNLSYEMLDVLASYDWGCGFRTYAGAGYIVRNEPHLDPLSTQGGIEWIAAKGCSLPRFTLRPIVAFDVKHHQEGGWAGDYSPRIGVQLSNGTSRSFQLLLEYFHGKSPNGQFYVNNIEYLGIGAHLHF